MGNSDKSPADNILDLPIAAFFGLLLLMTACSGGLGLATSLPAPGRYAAILSMVIVAGYGGSLFFKYGGAANFIPSVKKHPGAWLVMVCLFVIAINIVLGTMNAFDAFFE